MTQTFLKTWQGKVALGLFIVFSLWWLLLQTLYINHGEHRQVFSALYGIMALWGALWGFGVAQKWGGFKSALGKSLIFFSLGLLFQEFGQIVYSFYIYYLRIDIPYPSIGDIGYFGSVILYIFGIFMLWKVVRITITTQSIKGKLQFIFIPLILLFGSYFAFLQGYSFIDTAPLQIALDFGYPIGQAICVSMALITLISTHNFLGGVMKRPIVFLLIALIVQYLSDSVFLYQVSNGTWVVGGFNDYLYFISYFLMTIALMHIGKIIGTIREA